ncbi:MAG: DoxX family protein, partial [Chitinophagales bacterium]|nr:DoxX family protein [Chitinophagales bacterium]
MNSALLKDIGYAIIRIGIGVLLAMHGWPKIIGGVKDWEDLGGVMKDVFGISFFPAFWGFCAAFAEFAGGICIALGFLFRPACALVLFVMLVALSINLINNASFGDWAESAEVGVTILGMLLMGAGRFSL